MKELSATEASRGFAALLDAVEFRGESFAIRRNGHVVARIEPATGATGAAVKGLLTGAPSDPAWADEVRALRADLPVAGSPWDA